MTVQSPSILKGQIPKFDTVDYVVFVILLVLFAGVGLYHAIMDRRRKKENPEEFLLGGRSMSIVPVAMSLAVTFMSALTILGTPAEMYVYNTMFMYLILALLFSMGGAGLVFIPFFYKLGVTSTFQYLEWRFHWSVRCLGSVFLILQSVIYMSFVLYAPCLALNAVTGLDLWGCVAGVCVVVTFYTALGGMKAVLWTDTFQFVIMLVGLLAIFIKGCMETDGFSRAWDIADREGRVEFDNFSFDPSTRHSFWSIVVGGGFLWMTLFGINQAQVQRCLSVSSVRRARLAILLNTPALLSIVLLTSLIGIVMFAYYVDCDPVSLDLIEKTDQLVPLFVMDTLSHAKGIPGIFVSAVFSGSLSSLSSALNAVSTAVYTDFIKRFCCKNLSEFQATLINKGLVVLFGLIAMAAAFLVSRVGSILQGSYTVYGILNGPLLSLFVLGMFFPWSNKWGAFAGSLTSLVFMCWIGIGGLVHEVSTAVKSPVRNCTNILDQIRAEANGTGQANLTMADIKTYSAKSFDGVESLYSLSYLYYTVVGMTTAVIVGLIVSFLTGYTRPSTLDPKLICPLFDVLFPCLPEVMRRPLRCGIDHSSKNDVTSLTKGEKHDVIEQSNGDLEKQSTPEKVKIGMDNPAFYTEPSSVDTKL